ncbi:autoinducer binding domain-containing protein [Variovorax sp. JS1663]|uniref:autoinducer binding domain-containing protein n=1 Tax=Variovorax sp. JS1663 TaxID=1851577 RepID=UPI000B341CF1|nr:autoinducer binding domain-containing protein [Variovorax sp. JS1663]OUL98901.1 LuxR family transcriptional regulator [Variovorax sp. JS1663]
MKNWQEDLLRIVAVAPGEQNIFDEIVAAARGLGFEYCAYGIQFPFPLSQPKVHTLFDYPLDWARRYHEAGYVATDPTVLHARRSRTPLVWSDGLFAPTPQLWAEAKSFGLRVGWAQSNLDANGVVGMLSLSRSSEAISANELKVNEPRMRWLVNVAHQALTQTLMPKLLEVENILLTGREIEALKWTADGKTAAEIGQILAISVDTVNFHLRNATAKLGATNKTAAVVRAVILGLLN